MKTTNIIGGLQILSGYYTHPGGYNCGAEHDVLYGYPTDRKLSEEDLIKMIDLGWHQDHDERNYNEDYSVKDYRQDEGWSAYT